MERKVILYIAMSLDGYIATKENSIEFLSMVEQQGEDYGYADFVKSVDTVIIGRKTYDKVLAMGFEYPHVDKDVYIITRKERPAIGNFKFYTGDMAQLVNNLKAQSGKNIYCDGGAEVANEMMKNNHIDELIVSIIPVLLGDGIKLFNDGRPEKELSLVSSKQFESGLVQLHYKIAAK
ncbi:MAG: dihydrofolate reductase family protein [Bacteroidia bacterium]